LEINLELISKFMLICSFHKKISSVNSQLSKEINFGILFRNLGNVLFCEISWKKFHLWLVSRPVFTNIERSVVNVGFQKFISNVKVLTFERKILEIFISK